MKRLGFLVILSLSACGSSDEPANTHHNHVHNNATTAGAADVYADGLMKMGHMGNFHVMLMGADPAPPDVGDNTWTLRVMDTEQNPIDGAKVTVTPYMPLHGHGTSPADYTATFGEDGTYQVGPFDLFMPGVWETTVKVEGEVKDSVMFAFELEG